MIQRLLLCTWAMLMGISIGAEPAHDQKTIGDKNKQNQARPPVRGIDPEAPGLTTGSGATMMQAQANRVSIESQSAPFSLPLSSIIVLDTTWNPASGQSMDGRGSTLYNNFDSNARSLTCRGAGIGYIDSLTVTGPNEVTLANRDAALNYKAGQPAYFFLVDGFEGSTGQLRTLHGINYSDATNGKIRLSGPPLDSRLTGGKWFSNAVSVGNIAAGTTQIQVPANRFHKNDVVDLTEGTTIANEGRHEFNGILGFSGPTVTLKTPVQRSYNAAVLAQCVPVNSVTIKNVTINGSPADDSIGTAQINQCSDWTHDTVTIAGLYLAAGCGNFTFTNCTFNSALFTACHDFTFINCTFNVCRMEEACFNFSFIGCTITGSLGSNLGCHWLTLKGCSLTGTDSYMGIEAPGSIIEGLTCGSGTGGVFLQGDNWTVMNVTSACTIAPEIGNNFLLINVTATAVNLGKGIASPPRSGGRVQNTANTHIFSGQWRIIP